MPVVRAGPNQFLLIGHGGRLENKGSAVQAILRPGAIYVLVPSTKQEATFEFTQETLRRQEELELAQLARQRRMQAETVATERQALALERERFHAEMEAEQDRVAAEAPVRLLRITAERDLLREELEMRTLQNQVKALDVEHELLLPRAQQEMRREMLPIEQAPQIVEAASKVLQGTNLSLYGENGQLLGQLAPVFEVLAHAVSRATQASVAGAPGRDAPA